MQNKRLSTYSLYKESTYTAKQPDKNGIVQYTDEENHIWSLLFERQNKIIENRACTAYLKGLALLNFHSDKIPQCHEVSDVLLKATGWQVEPVNAVIPFQAFFQLLADKKFPAATFIRRRDELDYLQEPDIFHEFYGHCPLLTVPEYAGFMQYYGKLGLQATPEQRYFMARLFWFTIEFGLFQENGRTVCYGGGILSSNNETVYAIEDPLPRRQPLDVLTALRTPYRIDIMQHDYFVIKSFQELINIQQLDLFKLIDEAIALGDFPATFPTDDLQRPNEPCNDLDRPC